MNPVFKELLGSMLRKFLAMASVWAVSYGIFTTDETAKIIEAVVLLVTSVVWTLWIKYKDRIKFLTALASPAGVSEAVVIEKVKLGKGEKL